MKKIYRYNQLKLQKQEPFEMSNIEYFKMLVIALSLGTIFGALLLVFVYYVALPVEEPLNNLVVFK